MLRTTTEIREGQVHPLALRKHDALGRQQHKKKELTQASAAFLVTAYNWWKKAVLVVEGLTQKKENKREDKKRIDQEDTR